MNKRILFLILIIMVVFHFPLNAQSYDNLWKNVDALERKDLPQSTLKEVQKIYDKAEKEQNVPQMMKAFLTAVDLRARISSDSLKVDKTKLLNWAEETTNVVDQAVLYSIWSELTIIDQVKPAYDKLMLMLEHGDELKKVSASQYKPLVKTGVTSVAYFHDNLFDLLVRRAIDLLRSNRWNASQEGNQTEWLPKSVTNIRSLMSVTIEPASDCDVRYGTLKCYQTLLKAYDSETDRSAWLLTALNAMDYLKSDFFSSTTEESRLAEYQTWIADYATAKTIPEVYLAYCHEPALRSTNPSECLAMARKAIAKYPTYEQINALKNVVGEILEPSLNLTISTAYPNEAQDMSVNYRNVTGVKLAIYKINLPVTSPLLHKDANEYLSTYSRLIREERFDLEPTTDYKEKQTTLRIHAPSCGLYYIRAIPDGMKVSNTSGSLMYVTSMRIIYRPLPDNQQELVVVDAQTGHPIQDATITTYERKNNEYSVLSAIKVDENGTVCLTDKQRRVYLNASKLGDESMQIANLWTSVYGEQKELKPSYQMQLFTDRSIYRPGHTVYVSGLAYTQWKDDTCTLFGKQVTLTLKNAHNKDIGTIETQMNEFGSFKGEFILPSGGLSGSFTVWAKVDDDVKLSSQTGIRVEEYKRPTFEVSFEKVVEQYKEGDSIHLSGSAKTFAGMPVQQAHVHYKITRRLSWLWARMSNANWEGDTMTDDEGRFTVPVKLVGDDNTPVSRRYYTYNIMAGVTSMGGETIEGTTCLPVGPTSLFLQIGGAFSGGEWIKEKKEAFTFEAYNLLHEPMDVKVHYQLVKIEERLKEMPEPDNADKYEETSLLDDGFVNANTAFIMEKLSVQPAGWYRVKIDAKDERGRVCTAATDFLLLSLNDTRLPVHKTEWSYKEGNEFNDENPPALYFGTSEKNVYLLYDIFSGNKRVESRRMLLTDEVVKWTYPYKSEYGDGIFITWAFVKNGVCYNRHTEVIRPRPNKRLVLKWNVFRDRLRPGQQEEWRMSILDEEGKPVYAELLAMMYDASLDKLYPHSLYFNVAFNRFVPRTVWRIKGEQGSSVYASVPYRYLTVKGLDYTEMQIPMFRYNGMYNALPVGRGVVYEGRMVTDAVAMAPMRMAKSANMALAAVTDASASLDSEEMAEEEISLQSVNSELDSVEQQTQIRENFNETAFFYPQLRTDEKGEVSIAFTLPESLTTWKFVGLAHTKEVDYGQLSTTATATKDFMLQPNVPRFVRTGDDAHIVGQVMNLSEKTVSGIIRFELFDPETNEVFHQENKPFSVEAGKMMAHDFRFMVSDKHQVLAVRMVAEGGDFSDGEQHYLPVLSTKQWLTETVPLYINGKGEKVFSLESLFNRQSRTATGKKMTVELTANPAWYAVYSLPALSNPENESVISWSTAYYAHALAKYIADTHPKLKQAFDVWRTQGNNKENLLSQLQKNQDLKNILMEETPWVLQAENEEEQRRRVSTLFDLDEMTNKLAVSEQKLREMQKNDGGWSWFDQMEGNRYITTEVMKMFARLQSMTKINFVNDMQRMFGRGMDYLYQGAKEEYRRMKAYEKKYPKSDLCPSETTLDYLYIWSLVHPEADYKLYDDEFKLMTDYFLDKLEKRPQELSIYGKAIGAVIFYDFNRKEKAHEFMQSLMEYTVMTEEMGRYYDSPKALYSWSDYRIPTEVAAIEAVNRITKDQQIIDEMQRWLLKQKQTQCWITSIASANAVYALLNIGQRDLLANAGEVRVQLGKAIIRPDSDDAWGYVRKPVTGKDMDAQQVMVRKESEGISWGAVYAQCFEDMDKVLSNGKSLSITRQILKNGKPIDDSMSLAVGDKLTIQLHVVADRDMDFVQIKDERAACMEPLNVISGYRWNGHIGVYQSTKDTATYFYADAMRKGEYTLQYQVYITRKGQYTMGVPTIQSAYAPEYSGHGKGLLINVR